MLKKFALLATALVILGAAALVGLYIWVDALGKVRLVSRDIYAVRAGATPAAVIKSLTAEPSNLRIKLYTYLHSGELKLKANTYDLTKATNLQEALVVIKSGRGVQVQVRLIPGRPWKEYKKVLTSNPNLVNDIANLDDAAIAKKAGILPIDGDEVLDNLEGYFAPETYIVGYKATVSSVLKIANALQLKNLQQAWSARDPEVQPRTPYGFLTLASIVEKEKGNNEEAPKIAAVFNNRLIKDMRLQADPTVIYGLGDAYNGNITKKHLQTPTPYNTYTIFGLPPSPISNPDVTTLQATAHPADVDYLFFVAIYGQQKHVFATQYSDHERNVRALVNKQVVPGN